MTKGGKQDRLVLSVHGFYLPVRSVILTDRKIPHELQRFFSDQGIHVSYFQ
jgi:hypothetical protein